RWRYRASCRTPHQRRPLGPPPHSTALGETIGSTCAVARRLLPMLEPMQPMFCEEPVLPERPWLSPGWHHHLDPDCHRRAPLLAVGLLCSVAAHRSCATRPVPRRGLSEVRRIASMAEMHGV